MSITVPEPVAQRGRKDARRHREKQREAIREKLPEIIAEESIITRAKGKTIKIPIRSIEIPNFRSGYRKKGLPSILRIKASCPAWNASCRAQCETAPTLSR